ncbi:MAG: hypothetical protein IPL94_00490 [Tetrasphaera sp.]|nr:hypothetical protein [Tetrasphaera sp.]
MKSMTAYAVAGACAATLAVGVGSMSATAAPSQTSAIGTAIGVSAANESAPPSVGWRWFAGLNDTQRACMNKAKVERPLFPMTDAEKAALQVQVRAAATECGIPLPDGKRREQVRAFWEGLAQTQRDCLKAADLTRPLGPLSPAERADLKARVKAAADTCGVTLPSRAPAPSTPPAK